MQRLLDPRHLGRTFDRDWRRPALILTATAVCLLFIHYAKFQTTFETLLQALVVPATAATWLAGTYGSLWAELWWGAVHLLGYVLLPVLFLRLVLRERALDHGWRWGDTTRWLGWCALLALPIIGAAWVVSASADFQQTYPFYDLAGRSITDFLLWQCIYLAQFIMLEFFFRGFLLHSLAPTFGAASIFIMAVPYTMIHFDKPGPEATGAIVFGILLGVIALRSFSLWGGALVHMSIALAMDVMALVRTGRMPTEWWPT